MIESDSISSYPNEINGGFRLMALPAGIYSVTINSGVDAYRDTTITGVTVTARQDTNIGTIVLRQI